ncbi:MAG TPA: carotenoid 1,2-hydratase [Steroidobacteraceae bacterium]
MLGVLLCIAAWARAQEPPAARSFAPVIPGYTLQFPRDYGSHPQFGIEWWYVTGWLTTAKHETLGFQITFFRTRPAVDEPNPSNFAPHQLLIAHCAISDPAHAKLWHDQRVRREGLGLAEAQELDTHVWVDDWALQRRDGSYRARARAQDFQLDLILVPAQPPLLNGAHGFSQKGPQPQAASYYYSQPHLRVSGSVVRAAHSDAVSGEAWLDHEWSSDYLAQEATGWDWMGLNLDDGGAVMAFRIRDRQGKTYWSAATVREPDGQTQTFGQQAIEFTVQRRWRSPHTGVSYPVSDLVRIGARQFKLEPLLDDQENDTRLTSGAIYWEGAVSALENQRPVGRGYLELTGYDRPLSWR